MNTITITQKAKNKHLDFIHYEFIISQVKNFDIIHGSQRRNTNRTTFLRNLALSTGTSLSNLYSIIKDATVTVRDTELIEYSDLSAYAAFHKRSKKRKISNISKLDKAAPFIKMVEHEIRSNKLSSIDETIHYLKLHDSARINGLETICTKTFYNYVHRGKCSIKPIDLPRMLRRKPKKSFKTYTEKKSRGTSIEDRPVHVELREEFGHWEGDLVTGPRDGQSGAYLTLIERKTRFYYMIPISSKSSKKVYMQINKLHKFYGDLFSDIFKSITFDNGSEFARWKDMETKPGTSKQRLNIYFGRPYHSCDRGSNENCNGLIRFFIKKGTDINSIPKNLSIEINRKINNKKRKILGYLSSQSLFLDELSKIGRLNNSIFYEY